MPSFRTTSRRQDALQTLTLAVTRFSAVVALAAMASLLVHNVALAQGHATVKPRQPLRDGSPPQGALADRKLSLMILAPNTSYLMWAEPGAQGKSLGPSLRLVGRQDAESQWGAAMASKILTVAVSGLDGPVHLSSLGRLGAPEGSLTGRDWLQAHDHNMPHPAGGSSNAPSTASSVGRIELSTWAHAQLLTFVQTPGAAWGQALRVYTAAMP